MLELSQVVIVIFWCVQIVASCFILFYLRYTMPRLQRQMMCRLVENTATELFRIWIEGIKNPEVREILFSPQQIFENPLCIRYTKQEDSGDIEIINQISGVDWGDEEVAAFEHTTRRLLAAHVPGIHYPENVVRR